MLAIPGLFGGAGTAVPLSAHEYAFLLWPTLGSAAFIGGLSLYLWRRRETKGARPLALVGFLLLLWCLAAAVELATTEMDVQRLAFLLRDALTLPGVILALWFALDYAGLERWLTRPVVAVLVGVVLVNISLYVLDGGRLIWSSIWWDQEIVGNRGPLGIVFGAFALSLFILATAVFVLLFVRSPAHRVPVALILLGQLALRVVYPLGLFNLVYVPNIPATVLSFDFVAIMYTIALFRFRLFDLVPVARQTILERIPDAMLILDTKGRVADFNDVAAHLLELSRALDIGQPTVTALARYPDLARCIAERAGGTDDVAFRTSSGPHTCEVNNTLLTDWQGSPIGRLVVLHDTTDLRRAEAKLVDRERALAAAQERTWVARELHDGLAQDLWLAKLKAARLAALPGLGPEVRALTKEVSAAVDSGLAEAQQAVAAMRLPGDASGSLQELMARWLDDFEDQFGLRVRFECDSTLPPLSPRTEAEALHIVQEALTNVRRHADATVVRVRAGREDGHLVLVVGDNGRGFDPGAVGDAAFGLASMRERASLVGGELEIESAPRKGTRVQLTLPLQGASSVSPS